MASTRRLAVHGWSERPAWLALWSVAAAFGAYACMYGLRKPFTAGAYSSAPFGEGFKAWLVTAQVLGYTLSKFIGIRVVSSLAPTRRAWALMVLVVVAELALVLFALLPSPANVIGLFLNGLPLGMVFGLVLGFLEGRRMTEALVAGLCASFILADGVAKTVGAGVLAWGIPERWMPAAAGGMFLVPLVGFVWMLSRIPPPTDQDVAARAERPPLSSADRGRWIRRHGVGLGLIILAYLVVTVLRSLRADFAPELWRALGSAGVPEVFTRSEWWVMLGVVAASGGAIWVKDHRRAISLSLGTGLGGLGLVAYALTAWPRGDLSPFGFMVLAGLGLYLPYVAIHTTVFERLIALTRDRGNLGYLMYLADATGYLGYVVVMLASDSLGRTGNFLDFFQTAAWVVVGVGGAGLGGAWWHFAHFHRRSGAEKQPVGWGDSAEPAKEIA
jgi:hypothetical protein